MLAKFLPLLFLFSFAAPATEFVVPPLTGPVVDPGSLLSRGFQDELSAFLHNFVARGGAQIQVAILPTIDDLAIEEVSIKITDQWKLGKRKEDRGVLLLLATAQHKVRIEVGQGLEGDLTDVTSNRIIREVIAPALRAGSADQAVRDGVMAIAHYTDPKLLDEDAPAPRKMKSGHVRLITIFFWLLILLFFLRPGGRGGMGGLITYGLLGGFGGGGGSWGGGSGGGGGWSGGGGGFSGGGSSGDW